MFYVVPKFSLSLSGFLQVPFFPINLRLSFAHSPEQLLSEGRVQKPRC